MAYDNQEFRSIDLNAPPLSGQVGVIPVLFNACLVNGYLYSITPTSITRVGATITVNVSAADGLKIKIGHRLTISGVTGPGGGDGAIYNVAHTVLTTPTTTSYTWLASGTPSGSATGTLVVSSALSITTLTRGGTGNLTATATLAFPNTTLAAGDKIQIQGCTGTGAGTYNGRQAIVSAATASGVTTVTYLMASDPGADASGAPSYYKAGLQWVQAATGGTNSQSYVSQDTTGVISDTYTPRPFQIVDNAATTGGAKEAQIWGYESITTDQNGAGLFPTVVQLATGAIIRKSSLASTLLRDWTFAGDGKGFIFAPINGDAGFTSSPVRYGYIIPTKSGDAYNTFLATAYLQNTAAPVCGASFISVLGTAPAQATTSSWMPRLHTQSGTSVVAAQVGVVTGCIGAAATLYYPNPADAALYTQRIYIGDMLGNLRGRLPGIYGPLHAIPLTQWDTSINNVGLPGVVLRAVSIQANSSSGQLFYDIAGPWN